MQYTILHSDIDHCYAQIEEMNYPELRSVAMAVGGNEEKRHGIILAKNDIAKSFDIKTGDSLYEAKQKCPHLVIIHPNYEEYIYITEKIKDIYRLYSDRVESYGLDEAWIDVTESCCLYGDGLQIAKKIQMQVLEEVGLTISIGVSFNKIFAKIASDMNKPNGLTHITEENYKELIWRLPVGDLFYVGRATLTKLQTLQVNTVKDLALSQVGWMKDNFGKIGEVLWWFANGKDTSKVALMNEFEVVKSIGNAITAPRDIESLSDAKIVYYVLVESVAARMKEAGLQGSVIAITFRDTDLKWHTRQRKIMYPTDLAVDIIKIVIDLLAINHNFSVALRTIGVSISSLTMNQSYTQLNLFIDEMERKRQCVLEQTIDLIRDKFGFDKVKRCVTLLEKDLSSFNPKEDHIIHPASYF